MHCINIIEYIMSCEKPSKLINNKQLHNSYGCVGDRGPSDMIPSNITVSYLTGAWQIHVSFLKCRFRFALMMQN